MGDKAAARQTDARAGLPLAARQRGPVDERSARRAIARRDRLPGDPQGRRRRRRARHARRPRRARPGRGCCRSPSRGARRLRQRRRLPREVPGSPAPRRGPGPGDHHGHIIALGERDCSLQRRHQKVLEEAPAPGLPRSCARPCCARRSRAPSASATRTPAPSSSWSTATASFYFMEMNTRIQVEHPVTEMVTGIDLVTLADPHRRRRASDAPTSDDSNRAGTPSSAGSTPKTRRATSAVAGHGQSFHAAGRPRRAGGLASLLRLHRAAYYDSLLARASPGARSGRGRPAWERALAETVITGLHQPSRSIAGFGTTHFAAATYTLVSSPSMLAGSRPHRPAGADGPAHAEVTSSRWYGSLPPEPDASWRGSRQARQRRPTPSGSRARSAVAVRARSDRPRSVVALSRTWELPPAAPPRLR